MKKYLALVIALVMLLSITSAVAFADETVELTMWTFLDVYNPTNGRAIALGQLIERFEEAHPNIKVKVEAQDHSTLAAKYYAAFTAGNAPDVVQVNVREPLI